MNIIKRSATRIAALAVSAALSQAPVAVANPNLPLVPWSPCGTFDYPQPCPGSPGGPPVPKMPPGGWDAGCNGNGYLPDGRRCGNF
jgi:hypothetical protein